MAKSKATKKKEPVQKDHFWFISDDGGKKAIVFTTTTKKLKTKVKPMGTYTHGKHYATQYLVAVDSPEFPMLLKELGLTDKHRLKGV